MLYVQPVLLALRTCTRQRAGVGVAVGGIGVMVAVGVAVAKGVGVLVAGGVGVFVLVDTPGGVEVEMGVPVESRLHIEKSFAMHGPEYQPSVPNDRLTLCVPSATGTK